MSRCRFFVLLLAVEACGPGDPLQAPTDQVPVRLAITPSTVTLIVPSQTTLGLTGYNEAGSRVALSGIRWRSSAPQVVTVSSAGEVTAHSRGTATITAEVGVLAALAAVNVVAAGLQVTPLSARLVPHAEIQLGATPLGAAGTPVLPAPQVIWFSSDSRIASISGLALDGHRALVRGHRGGTVTITASSLGVSRQIVVTVDPEIESSGGLTVLDFHVVEYEYEDEPGSYLYAPQLRVAEATGAGSVDILELTVSLPGFARPLPPVCASYRLGPSAIQDLFTESLGDFPIAFWTYTGRATGTTATALLGYRDGSDGPKSLTLSGPVVRGSFPAPSNGDLVNWAFCWSR